MDIREHLNEEAHYIDGVLADCLAPLQGSVLHAAMSYALLSPGKRALLGLNGPAILSELSAIAVTRLVQPGREL